MTYGEAYTAEKNSIDLVDGKWVKTVHIENKPEPMSREDAVRYYNIKLFNFWLGCINPKASLLKRKKLVSALMFGHVDYYKKYKELR